MYGACTHWLYRKGFMPSLLSADNVPMRVKDSLTLIFLPPSQNHGVFLRRKESV